MIKILEVDPNTNSAMSLYRGRMPLIRLQKKYRGEIEFHPSPRPGECNTEWDYLNIFDMVFLMRPSSHYAADIVAACKQFNIPVWVDFDDLLSDIPVNNPAYIASITHNTNKFIPDILEGCTFATFSTKYLMEKMGHKILHKSHVLPNAWDMELFRKPQLQGMAKKIIWRGSGTHERDLKEFEAPIRDIIRGAQAAGEKWVIEFMGDNPIHITDYVDSEYTPYMGKSSYFKKLSNINAKINIVPLSHRPAEIDFNKSKSNIAWMEMAYAGLVSLAPDWDEWRLPGVVNYTTKQDFAEKLSAMMRGDYNLEKLRQESWRYIRENLTLDKINEERFRLINLYLKAQYQTETV